MAYEVQYTANFTNEKNQEVLVSIAQKDAAPTTPINYMVTQMEINDNGDDQTKYNCIISRELVLGVLSEIGSGLTWETFISSTHDEWFVSVLIDGMKYFEGYITPDEGTSAFQDQPYEVQIRASTGLSLLKDQPLTDVNGDNFTDDNKLIEYIAGALSKTLLSLPIRIYCNYLLSSMLNKGNGLEYDMFNQTSLNYRTFLKDPINFVSCHEALKIILDKFCTLEYWNGFWQIVNIADKQYVRADWFYVDYEADGSDPVGAQVTENHAQIGKNVDIFPIKEDQQISSRFAVKSVKTKFDYEVWPELPKNNKFERGTVFETGPAADEDDIDNDGNTAEIIGTYKKVTIDDWEFGQIFNGDTDTPPYILSPPTGLAYTKRVFNEFNVEIDRKIIIDLPTTSVDYNHWLRSEGIPINKGSKIKVGFKSRFPDDITTGGAVSTTGAIVYILSGVNVYKLEAGYPAGRVLDGKWELVTGFLGGISIAYPEDGNSTEPVGVDVTSDPVPADGILYYVLNVSGRGDTPGPQIFTDVTLEIIPFVAGGYIAVKGDYYLREQTPFFPDVTEDEVKISDSPMKVLKGALIFDNGVVNVLTDPNWYRIYSAADTNPDSERYGFKELLNLGRINNAYRRMWALEGSFSGLTYAPENDQLNIQPLGFHKRYRLVDLPAPRDFVLVTPLQMDVITGHIKASLVEVRKDENDGTQLTDNVDLKYLF